MATINAGAQSARPEQPVCAPRLVSHDTGRLRRCANTDRNGASVRHELLHEGEVDAVEPADARPDDEPEDDQ